MLRKENGNKSLIRLADFAKNCVFMKRKHVQTLKRRTKEETAAFFPSYDDSVNDLIDNGLPPFSDLNDFPISPLCVCVCVCVLLDIVHNSKLIIACEQHRFLE